MSEARAGVADQGRSRLDQLELEIVAARAGDSDDSSRADFVARAVVAGGALAAGGMLVAGLPRLAASAPSAAQDKKILNFALLLEYIEAGFYAEAFAKGKLSGELQDYVSIVRRHERWRRVRSCSIRERPTGLRARRLARCSTHSQRSAGLRQAV